MMGLTASTPRYNTPSLHYIKQTAPMRYALLIIALGCTPPPAQIAPDPAPAPLLPRKAHDMTAEEFVEAAFGYTESECTVDEFYAAFGEPQAKNARAIYYNCRDVRVVTLYVDAERWEAGFVEIVDVDRE